MKWRNKAVSLLIDLVWVSYNILSVHPSEKLYHVESLKQERCTWSYILKTLVWQTAYSKCWLDILSLHIFLWTFFFFFFHCYVQTSVVMKLKNKIFRDFVIR